MKLDVDTLRRLAPLLDTAIDLDETEREPWLAGLHGDEALLAPLLRDLLNRKAIQSDMDALERGASFTGLEGGNLDEEARHQAGETVGPYRLLRELGRGGMGSVWLATRVDGALKREIALKLPHTHMARRQLAERFAKERDILASLVHANIARLYDAGISSDGQPYLALEYVEGQSLTAWCDARQLTVKGRVELFRQVLAAVQYAHSQQVIHRDLKPNNILVTPQGEVRLLDFGIAKMMDEQGQAHETELTQAAGRALSVQYASPEQILGQPVMATSDVYSLGVVLYELLTGSFPYFKRRDTRTVIEDGILSVEATRPSLIVSAPEMAARRGTDPNKLSSLFKGDMDSLLQKALKKNPAERYATVQDMAMDLDLYLQGKPVRAKPDSNWYLGLNFFRRNRVAATAIMALMMLGGIAQRDWLGAILTPPQPRAEPPALSMLMTRFTALDNDAGSIQLAEQLPRELTMGLTACCRDQKVVRSDLLDGSGGAVRGNVRYRVEGDVQSTPSGAGVNLRLIELSSASQVWATRFDLPPLDGSFEAKRKLRRLTGLLGHALDRSERRRVLALPLDRLTAMELVLRGKAVWEESASLKNTLAAQELYAAALRLDPNLVPALVENTMNWDAMMDVDPRADRAHAVREMDKLSARAVALDPADAWAWDARATALMDEKHWDAAVAAVDKVIAIDPLWQRPYGFKATLKNLTGRPAEALPLVDYAVSIDPENAGWPLRVACQAHMLLGQYEKAIANCEKAAGSEPTDWWTAMILAASYAQLGEMKKAVAAKDLALRSVPEYSIARLQATMVSDVPAYLKMAETTWYAGLRKAGLPEK